MLLIAITALISFYILYKRIIELRHAYIILLIWVGYLILFVAKHIKHDVYGYNYNYYHEFVLLLLFQQMGLAIGILNTRKCKYTNTYAQKMTYYIIIVVTIFEIIFIKDLI